MFYSLFETHNIISIAACLPRFYRVPRIHDMDALMRIPLFFEIRKLHTPICMCLTQYCSTRFVDSSVPVIPFEAMGCVKGSLFQN